jgi:hypothetical protein
MAANSSPRRTLSRQTTPDLQSCVSVQQRVLEQDPSCRTRGRVADGKGVDLDNSFAEGAERLRPQEEENI